MQRTGPPVLQTRGSSLEVLMPCWSLCGSRVFASGFCGMAPHGTLILQCIGTARLVESSVRNFRLAAFAFGFVWRAHASMCRTVRHLNMIGVCRLVAHFVPPGRPVMLPQSMDTCLSEGSLLCLATAPTVTCSSQHNYSMAVLDRDWPRLQQQPRWLDMLAMVHK